MCKHQVPKPGFRNLLGLETRGQTEIPSKTRPQKGHTQGKQDRSSMQHQETPALDPGSEGDLVEVRSTSPETPDAGHSAAGL